MSIEKRYNERYKNKDMPWDTGIPDFNLVKTIKEYPIKKCKTLEIGCGVGTDSLWLAAQGFNVQGIDSSEIAVNKAKNKIFGKKIKCNFLLGNIFKDKIKNAPFDFIYDRGCFHSFKALNKRKIFAKKIAENLKKDGLWLSLVASADDKVVQPGPPRHTVKDIALSVELFFEIIFIKATNLGTTRNNPHKAFLCLMRKRKHTSP